MKTNALTKLLATLSAAALFTFIAAPAQAGPAVETYRPVTSLKQAQALPVGSHIAVSCSACGGITMMTVDKSHSFLRGYTCPTCQREFHLLQPGGGGRAAAIGQVVYVDKDKHIARLTAANPR